MHQRAPIGLMDYLRNNEIEKNDSILFLTPCHSTPYYSYLHKNIKINFLTCEPNLGNKKNYQDEADIFFSNPIEWVNQNEIRKFQEATYIVLFEGLYFELLNCRDQKIMEIFSKNFYICKDFFYSLTKQTKNTDKTLLLLCSKNKEQNLQAKNEL